MRQKINVKAVSKASFSISTPKSPRGDLLKSVDLKAPPGGLGVKSDL
jgi:hypothetical protein